MQNRPSRTLDKEYEMLLDALGFEPATFDSLAAGSAVAAHRSTRQRADPAAAGALRRTPAAAWWPNRFALTAA
jgi:hypothetical protein